MSRRWSAAEDDLLKGLAGKLTWTELSRQFGRSPDCVRLRAKLLLGTALPRKACQNCGRVVKTRPRQLCHKCYYAEGVRQRFGNPSRYNRVGPHAGVFLVKPCCEATQALPGTLEKVAVLEERAALGVDLWHPSDARWDGEGCLGLAPEAVTTTTTEETPLDLE